jgi:hypothetical protein
MNNFFLKLLILMSVIPFLIFDKLKHLLSTYFPFVFVILLIIITLKYMKMDKANIPTLSESIKTTRQYIMSEKILGCIKNNF